MNLSMAKKKEWEDLLKEYDLIKEGESIEEHTAGDYYTLLDQKRGNYFFTQEAVIFVSGYGFNNVVMPYKDIKEMKKCFVGPFIPTGIKLSVINEKGKLKKHKLSVLKRASWMEYIAKRAGISF